jgi:phage/plasmid-associated DNA primase
MHSTNKPLGAILVGICLLNSSSVLAQTSSKQKELSTQQCVEQQRTIHQRFSDKVSDADFISYCSCVVGVLEKRLTPEQFRDIGNSAKGAKPAWLKQAEQQAGRSCIPSEPKLQV